MDTMNLNESDDGMVPLDNPIPQKPAEKNIQTKQMDSTPISDVMPSAPIDQEGMMYAQAAQPSALQQQQMMQMMQQQQQQQQPQQKMGPPPNQNPLGIADDQFQALVAGVCAIIAFSKPVQEKLLSTFPQFLVEGGLSTTGLLVVGLIAAILYYIVQRFILKRTS